MPPPFELTFGNVIGTYNALWDLSGRIATTPGIDDGDKWILTFREGLRGMLARILTVDREYLALHRFQAGHGKDIENPNEWAVTCESHAAGIFFGMDSTVECFVFAMNAIGFLKSPPDFCDIREARALRQVGPKNILCSDASDKRNPKPGYAKFFPGIVSCFWKYHLLLGTIFEYHDVSKHRSAVITGGNDTTLHVREDPKEPDSRMSSTEHTLESLAHKFQEFVDDLLPIALEETARALNYTVVKKDLRG